MTKRLIPLGGAALAALGVLAVALAGNGGSNTSPVRTSTQPAAEISGPCDEAEHANDPRCTAVAAAIAKAKPAVKAERRHEAGEDSSGPGGRRNDDQAEARGRAAENEVEVENRGREAENEVEAEDENEVENEVEAENEVENEVENEPAKIEDDHSGPGGDDQNDDNSGHGSGSGDEDRSGSNSGSG